MAKPTEPRRKPREKPGPYKRQTKPGVPKATPASSAIIRKQIKRDNLTLHDWMVVFAFIDDHPDMGQAAVVEHFASKIDGALIFTQSTLSRKIKMRPELEERVNSNPNALSAKRARIVTRPDIERALVLWFKQMEAKQETVTGPMLREKRKRFEEMFGVPENERLLGDGWISSFCKA